MNILLISECKGAALKETRRIIDQFAERTGQRSWQTAITEAGLKHLHQLLRKTARRNSAISCYWTRGRNHTELLWVVGNRRHFNERGRVPICTTTRKIPSAGEEQSWPLGEVIQITAAIAALMHDLGKATVGFQQKLHNSIDRLMSEPDPYRHEWVSLLLFLEMVKGCESNQALLERLANFGAYRTKNPDWHQNLAEKTMLKRVDLSVLPPFGRLLSWLIVTHHRLMQKVPMWERNQLERALQYPLTYFWKDFRAYEFWVYNPLSKLAEQGSLHNFLRLQADATENPYWQKALKRWANRGLRNRDVTNLAESIALTEETEQKEEPSVIDPLLLYLSRLVLITGDHNYSALDFQNSQKREVSLTHSPALIANLDRESQSSPLLNGGKQSLEAHLLGVTEETVKFTHLLPKLRKGLPRLKEHKPFQRRTKLKRFKWQDRIYDLLKSEQRVAERQGFFGISMASTGCGKTIGNAKMAAALAGEQGVRFTIALGLRTLTQQTAESLKEALELNSEMIATLIGGESVAIRQRLEEQWEKDQGKSAKAETIGSESAHQFEAFETAELLGGMEEGLFSTEGGYVVDAAESHWIADSFTTLMRNKNDRKLLETPIVACTIDHLMAASESARGGRHIVPLLRLFSADLILDEPDDFALEDLPALSRLLYLCGLMGGRVILSSATLSPDFVAGLFTAYQEGRSIWNQHQQLGKASKDIVVAWVDEAAEKLEICGEDIAQFREYHHTFVLQRNAMLSAEPISRQAEILPWQSLQESASSLQKSDALEEESYKAIAVTILKSAFELHERYAETAPNSGGYSGERASIGLVRLSKIRHIIPLAKMLLSANFWEELAEKSPEIVAKYADLKIHLNVYHSRQVLVLRSLLESKLDRILLRKTPFAIFKQPEIKRAILGGESMRKDHLFIVLGSPVTEVGRDHDYDWAILEPSSHRSIVQLAGRVWRHRERCLNGPNMALLQSPVAYFITAERAESEARALSKEGRYYRMPGFESATAKLKTYDLTQLMNSKELEQIDARVRIIAPEEALNATFTEATAAGRRSRRGRRRRRAVASSGLSISPGMEVIYPSLATLEHGELRRLMQPNRVGSPDNLVTAFFRENYPYHALFHLQLLSPFRESAKETEYLLFPDLNHRINVYHAKTIQEAGRDWFSQLDNLPTHNSLMRINGESPQASEQISPWLTATLEEALTFAVGKSSDIPDAFEAAYYYAARRFSTVSLGEIGLGKCWVFDPFYGFYSERI